VIIAQAGAGMAICIGFGRFTVGLLLPAMRDDLGLSYALAGLLASINLTAYFVGVVFIPRIGMRIGYHRSLRLALAIALASFVVLALPVSVPVVGLGLAGAGVAGALGWISIAALGTAVASPTRRGRALGFIGGSMGLGMITASGIALLVAGDDGIPWRAVWAWEAILAAVVFLAVRPSTLMVRGEPRTAGPRPRGLVGLFTAYAAFGVAYTLFGTFFVAAVVGGDATAVRGAQLWALVGLGAAGGSLAFGTWSDAVGRRTALVASQLLGLAACASVLLDLADAAPVAALGGIAFGSIMTGMASLVPAALADALPSAQVPAVFASMTLVFAVVQAITPVLGGAIIDAFDGFAVVFLLGGFAFLCAGLAFLISLARLRPS
jgi:MFS family permease